MKIGKQAKVIDYEEAGAHDFVIGEIVTCVGLSEWNDTWYRFIDKNDHIQDLVELEFEWIESE
jgi:hypothetical protein